ncbi:peptide chain release factor N(5)-glutamine methyltransferase [Anaerobranca gottschalkii]|uniref:Release factor glutamine methyltransferase n=1 Tax=Anaerobranca gottschalkii DSM 13577 TaxID=1120990 RepID=A0A1I0BLP1_9FIRM|nr:peptide chain release factor N(5)-glutamine methyltransferase [Anaerobranca gottschalkii]SET07859.1 release factor glutamine methyltransferase [Anaerobranca gottschalkii DSM 13577]
MIRNIKEALIWASSYLKKQGIENPYFESQLLLKKLLNIPLVKLTLQENQSLTEKQLKDYMGWVEKRGQGYPYAYIVKEKGFMGLDFYVDQRVLIPRPDTEILVEWAISYMELNKISDFKTVDVGTGSGAIGISLAKYTGKKIYAVDLSIDSLEVAKLNSERLEVADKIKFFHGNLLEPLKKENIEVDLVVSNLPYIPEREYQTLQREVKEFEPYTALIGGESGLEIYQELVKELPGTLKKGGALAIEIAYNQGQGAMELLQKGGFQKVYILKDLAGRQRVAVGENFLEENF